MTTRDYINEYINSKAFMILSALALIATTALALAMGAHPTANNSTGIFFSIKGGLTGHGAASAAINLLCLLATGGVMLGLNKVFSYVRSMTHLFVSAFFWLQVANPAGLVAFNNGTLLCLVTSIVTMPLFASFQDRHAQRSIFLIFTIVAAGTMFHYGFLALIPALLLGFLNMGVLNLKGLLAMLFGLITPFWIVLGLGIAMPADFVMPHIDGIWSQMARRSVNPALVLAVLTVILGILLAVMNLMTIMNYRIQTRVYNAFFVFVLVSMAIALCIDYNDMGVYMPLLGLMTAVQIAHFHTLRTTRPFRFIFIVLLVAGCIGFYCANLMLP